MALESLKKSTPFIKAALLEKGQAVKGYYVGPWSSEMYPDRKSLKLVLSEDQTFKLHKKNGDDVVTETASLKKGDQVILQGGGNLKYFFEDNHPKGVLFHFVYNGMNKIKKGPAKGKDMHNFEILRDLDNTIEVAENTEATESTEDVPF